MRCWNVIFASIVSGKVRLLKVAFCYLLAGASVGAAAQSQPMSLADAVMEQDAEQREAVSLRDWWLVSTNGFGAEQRRFYVDRSKANSFAPQSTAWVDLYELKAKALSHTKFQIVATCNSATPRMAMRNSIQYGDGSQAAKSVPDSEWRDVVPGSSMETLWKFTCSAQPSNAIVFVPDGPEADARRYYAAN